LGYQLYDTEAIEHEAQKMGYLESVKEIDEKVPSLFHRLAGHNPALALARLTAIIYQLASRGDAVLLGRGSHILLGAFNCALNVRVVASRKTRIRNLQARGYHEELAPKAIEESGHERGAFTKLAFRVDWDNPELYDITLNMDKLNVEVAVDTVIGLARSELLQEASVDCLRSIEKLALARRAEAALLEAKLDNVSVSVTDPGCIHLSGYVWQDPDRARAEDMLKTVEGAREVENEILVIPRFPET
jgi:cytidylate kinase